jgi:ABC-2 type transport system ATP-binding protein
MPGEAAIQTRDLSKRYGAQAAVDRLNLKVAEGEVFGFLGPNGAGKTTTLLMLLGLTEPTSGSARVLGLDPRRRPIKVKRQVGYLQENMGFYRDLDARQMLAFIAELNDLPVREAEQRAEAALEAVGLAEDAGKKIGAYSRGMRQRLGLAEILLKQPRIAFLDEPTIGLDPDGTARMLEVIERLARERGMTVILCSHLLEQVERVCTRMGIMIGGRLVAEGTLKELRAAKFGLAGEEFTLEEIYLKYFRESTA